MPAVAEAELRYRDLLPTDAHDTPCRLITTDGVTEDRPNRRFLTVVPKAIQQLTSEAVHDIVHYLRPGHLQQLRKMIDGPKADNDERAV